MKWFIIFILLIFISGGIKAYRIEQKIDIINAPLATTSTTYTPTTGAGGIIGWNISAYTNILEIYYESRGKFDFTGIPDGVGSGFTRLYSNSNSTNASLDVALSGSPVYKKSENLTFLFKNGNLNLSIQVKAGVDSIANVYGARLVIVQDGNITKTRTYIPLGFSSSEAIGIATPLSEITDPKRWLWYSSDFGGNINAYFSGTWYRAGLIGNVFISLLDINTSSDITGTRLSHTSITPRYSTSSNITNLLTDGDILSVGWGEDGANSVVIQRNAFLIIDQININSSNPILTIPIQIENKKRTVNSTTITYDTTTGSYYNGSNWKDINMTHIADYTYLSGNNSAGDLALARLRFDGTQLLLSTDTTANLNYSYRRNPFNFANNETDSEVLDTGISNLGLWVITTITSSRLIIKINNTNSCYYKGGNWDIDCRENCNLTTSTNLNQNKVNFSGSSLLYINTRIFNYSEAIIQSCEVVITNLGEFG